MNSKIGAKLQKEKKGKVSGSLQSAFSDEEKDWEQGIAGNEMEVSNWEYQDLGNNNTDGNGD